MAKCLRLLKIAVALLAGVPAMAWADAASGPASAISTNVTASSSEDDASPLSFKEKMLAGLPPVIGDGLDFSVWGWLGGTHTSDWDLRNYFDAEVGLAVTKTFNQRVSISAQGNFIDANRTMRGELEQAYVSTVLNEADGAFLTVGKFNANFGTEARDFWSRSTGTTSVLFGAQPQDIVGAMATVPVCETGLTLKPFISADFQGVFDFNQSPSAGLVTEYQPIHGVDIALTNWVGPGFVLFGGHSIQEPFAKGAYGNGNAGPVTGNWQGPNLTAERGGTLYFAELKATWQIRPDLRAAIEGLVGTSGTQFGRWGWNGVMGQLDYDITDKWRVFGRMSYLDDSDWLITGEFQYIYEFSVGTAYQLYEGVELRGEYRHDRSNVTGDTNGISVHLALTY